VLDAFSGDSVPVHLLTVEAFETYLAHLNGEPASAGGSSLPGAIAVNVSNRYVDLEPVVRGVAQRFNFDWIRIHNRSDRAAAVYSADWIILTRDDDLLEFLTTFERVPPTERRPPILWTDAHSSLIGILK
jgi:hypothetical protein